MPCTHLATVEVAAEIKQREFRLASRAAHVGGSFVGAFDAKLQTLTTCCGEAKIANGSREKPVVEVYALDLTLETNKIAARRAFCQVLLVIVETIVAHRRIVFWNLEPKKFEFSGFKNSRIFSVPSQWTVRRLPGAARGTRSRCNSHT